MVEVGYLTDPLERRKGHARAALRIMIDVAREEPGVEVGEQWDEEDGLKIVFELCV